MNAATILIAAAIAALLLLAVRYLVKNGPCAACEMRGACRKNPQEDRKPSASACGGNCRGCQYYAQEQKMKAANAPAGKKTPV